MSFESSRRFGVGLVLLALIWRLPAHGQTTTNGIYADFTTSMGNFTCQLEYTRAPKTVANFIGLATGEFPWLNLTNGLVQTNGFYDGLTFHRVIAGFMIQGGSPNGQGTDGPGYAFVDEFNSQLTFNKPGILAMANSGPDSNGSQFFVTVAPYTNGNNTYTIFGHLVGDTNVVWAINHMATSASDKPLTNVVIQQVRIRRVGTAAAAFDIHAHGLPAVTNVPLQISQGSSNVWLTFSNTLYADNHLFSTTNVTGPWGSSALGIETSATFSNAVSQRADSPRMFYRLGQIQYPSSTFAPKDVHGRTITLTFTGTTPKLILNFNSTGSGTYNWVGQKTGTILTYEWDQQPYSGRLWPIQYDELVDMTFVLSYTSSSGGSFSGTAYTSPFSSALKGTFTSTGP